jgi:hypothetical protein
MRTKGYGRAGVRETGKRYGVGRLTVLSAGIDARLRARRARRGEWTAETRGYA